MAYFGDNAIHAWADIDGTGTPHTDGSYNVSGITDNGAGDYTVLFSTNAADANYCVIGSNIGEDNDAYTHSFICSKQIAPAQDGVRFACEHKSAGSRDQNHLSILVVASY